LSSYVTAGAARGLSIERKTRRACRRSQATQGVISGSPRGHPSRSINPAVRTPRVRAERGDLPRNVATRPRDDRSSVVPGRR